MTSVANWVVISYRPCDCGKRNCRKGGDLSTYGPYTKQQAEVIAEKLEEENDSENRSSIHMEMLRMYVSESDDEKSEF